VATQEDVRRIALGLPEVTEVPGELRFLVDGKAFAWPWLERIDPKRARVPNPEVLAVRIGHESEKETLIELDPAVFFTEPHYDGYAAILVRLPVIATDLLAVVLADAWRTRAPKRMRDAVPPRDRD
jgi:hypothetical protein